MVRPLLRRCGLALVAVALGSCASEVSSSIAASQRPETIVAASCGMFPAFAFGDRLQLDRDPGELRRGDIVYHRWPDPDRPDDFYLHRIVGLPGDRLEPSEDGAVSLNGARLVEDYLPAGAITYLREPVDIPADHYFLLGDNRDRSSDSRALGPLPRSAIEARVTKVIPVKTNDDDPC